jgi:translocation and assembly module TamA
VRFLKIIRVAAFGVTAPLACMAQAFDFKIEISDPELTKSVKNASLLQQLSEADTSSGQDVIAAARADYERIVGAMYDDGYFSPVVSIRVNGREASSISPLSAPKVIRSAIVSVQAGQKFAFGRTSISPVFAGTELPAEFAPSQPARISSIKSAADTAISNWRDAGHAKANLSGQQITAQHKQGLINAELTVDPGPRLTFGRLQVKGNKAVRTERIHDIAGLPEGTQFSPDEIRRASNRLRRTGTFRVAALNEAENYNPDLSLDVEALITEAPPRRFGFGAEISSLEGLGLSAYWLHRNLFGGAERLRVEGDISGIGGDSGGTDYSFGVKFDRPATFNEDTDFYALGQIERLDEVGFSSDQLSLEAGIRRYASDQREYTFGLGLRTAKVNDAFGERSYTLVTLPVSATFDYRDNKLNAKDGYYFNASLTPFAGLKDSDSGARIYLDGRAFKSVGENKGLTFALRGQLGSVTGPDLDQAPADYLFYSGGGGTVRGQEFQSLSVDLGGGQVVGGRSFLGISGEVRVKTTDSLSLVAFYDAGYIGREEFPDGDSGDWHSGAGFGIRYDTGIGPIRLDLGVPVTGPGEQNGFEIYIGIGQAF